VAAVNEKPQQAQPHLAVSTRDHNVHDGIVRRTVSDQLRGGAPQGPAIPSASRR
jgi:hypothetical protein